MIVSEVYKASLATSGKLKLRAKARLADGEPEAVFEAAVLLHETARAERRAVNALTLCPPETRLLASVEECWCLVEGHDPPGAGKVWGRILRERADVDGPTVTAILKRLTPKYTEQQQAFARAVAACPTLMRFRDARSMVVASAADKTQGRAELGSLLASFPGTASFWWMAYRLAEADGDKQPAWDALTKARELDPENPRFEAMSLLVGAWALPADEADEHLARVRGRFDSAGAEVCLMYALAEVQLARSGKSSQRTSRWERAHRAAQAGLAQAPPRGLRSNLLATEMLCAALLAGDKPTMEILYLAGLSALAVRSTPKADVAELLTASVRHAMPDAA